MSYQINTKKSWSATQQDLSKAFDLWGIKEWDTTYPRGARFEGYNQTQEERTVTLTYTKDGKQIVLAMGKQPRAVDNLRVLYLVIDALRLNEVRQMSDVFQSAYMQLSAPKTLDPYATLGVMRGQELETYEAVYRTAARKYHPDSKPSGDAEKFKEITEAIEIIRKELK